MIGDIFTVSFGGETRKALHGGAVLLNRMSIKERIYTIYNDCVFHRVAGIVTNEGDIKYEESIINLGDDVRACICVNPNLIVELELYRNEHLRIIGKLGKYISNNKGKTNRKLREKQKINKYIAVNDVNKYIAIKDINMSLSDAACFISELPLKDRLTILEHITLRGVQMDAKGMIAVDLRALIPLRTDIRMLMVLDPTLIYHLDNSELGHEFYITRVYNRYNDMLSKMNESLASVDTNSFHIKDHTRSDDTSIVDSSDVLRAYYESYKHVRRSKRGVS